MAAKRLAELTTQAHDGQDMARRQICMLALLLIASLSLLLISP